VFECRASGEPAPTIQWLHDGIPVLASEKFQFSHDGSLIIQNVARTDESVYQCVATNAAGVARAHAKLWVTSKLLFRCPSYWPKYRVFILYSPYKYTKYYGLVIIKLRYMYSFNICYKD
jgi:hypothetical protein